ncbi:neutral zinc metallopeptidase [Gordonia sp. ABSL1-1]|uniref:KPN_02809 family neutral zinc metallopeptidase n=1 Tax=Gordonia sp. ABSL1-1 TaxID=3053923 RepID=UPI002573DA6F|nr:neutral zinc metallopeptidase [Gordonia sp. ABSL1-1]MDL9937282.1 neutral zinc metallopeptidase [Gordonia sp. ABSL1-1]
MTFQGSGSINTDNVSASGGGGGGLGGGGGRIALGGGAGLILTIVALLFGVNPGNLMGSGSGSSTPAASQSALDKHISECTYEMANVGDEICRVVATKASLETVWKSIAPQYSAPKLHIFSGSVNTGGCGSATSATGPFYCPADETIYIDTSFYDDVLVGQLGGGNDALSQEYVIAHEYGHHIENITGVLNKGQRMGNNGSVRIELQADCLAGVWAHHADDGTADALLQPLTQQDIDQVGKTARSIGDDSIQGSNSNKEGWTHGSAAQRARWFGIGYQSGDPRRCDTFATNDL